MRPPEPIGCALCDDEPAVLRLIDLTAECEITGRMPEPGIGYVFDSRCERHWSAYRALLARRAERWFNPRPEHDGDRR